MDQWAPIFGVSTSCKELDFGGDSSESEESWEFSAGLWLDVDVFTFTFRGAVTDLNEVGLNGIAGGRVLQGGVFVQMDNKLVINAQVETILNIDEGGFSVSLQFD